MSDVNTPKSKMFSAILRAFILLLLVVGQSNGALAQFLDKPDQPVSITGPTFDIWREGVTSTYHADSSGVNFTGTLKYVVESAVEELKLVGGGSVIFQAGDFDLGSDWFEIIDATDVIFAGQGIDVTFLQNFTIVDADTEPFDMSRSDRITIRDMTVSAGGTERTTSDAIDFDGGDDNIVERVKVTSARGRGIIFDGKDAVEVSGGTADRNVVRDCIITGANRDGIQLLASNDNLIENCHIFDVGGDGIRVHKAESTAAQPNKPSNDNIIRNNLVENAGTQGIRVHAGNRNVISNNTVLNSSNAAVNQDGIRIESSNALSCDDNVVQLNTATDDQVIKTQAYGLRIYNSECNRTVVSDNDFSGNLLGEIRDDGTDTIYRSADTEPPTAPLNLLVESITSSQIDLTWLASTDNIAVKRYLIYRNGSWIGVVDSPETTFQGTAVNPDTTYQYLVRAQDTAGNQSAPSNMLELTTLPPPPALTFTPTDDAYIRESTPATNYNLSTIQIDADARMDGLVKFNVTGIGASSVASVSLRMFVMDSSSVGGEFFKMNDTSWSEDTVTWETAPPADGGSLGSLGPVVAGDWVEIDVTPLVPSDGAVSLRIISSDNNGVDYASKEHPNGNAPELIVVLNVTPDTEPPDAVTDLVATYIQVTAVTLHWTAASDNVGVVAYDIYRDGIVIDSVGAVTEYTDTTVSGNTSYQYIIRARDAAGNGSDPSNMVEVTTPIAPPLYLPLIMVSG